MNTNQQNESQSFQDFKTRIGHYSTLTEALAAAMLKGNLVWRIYDETREPYDLVEIYDFAKKYDQEHPITGTQFYWVSREGAIGISMGLEYRVKWMFIPMEPGLERDDLIEKMGERLVDVEGVKEALGTETETTTIVPPPILPSEPAMPPQPEPGPEPQLQPELQPVVGAPVPAQPMPQPAPMPEPQPQPARQPEPQPVVGAPVPAQPMAQPAPMPEPQPQPARQPEPQPVVGAPVPAQPMPQPAPMPEPQPQPARQPEPQPVVGTPVPAQPMPQPAPMPEPQPQPARQPEPQPVVGTPVPAQPMPQPAPMPEPQPQPARQPEPQPVVGTPVPAQPMAQPAPMPEPQPQPARQPEPQPVVGTPVPAQPMPQPAPQPAAQSGGKSKLPLILGGAVAALLIVGGGYYAFSHFAGSQETPAQQEEATATTAPSEPATAEPATPATPAAADAKALTTAALDELKSAATARQGIDKLNQAIAKGGKESVEALYTLAQLYGRVYKEKDVLAHVENLLPKDTKKAHELNEKAVALDPAYYPSLYELGCDYMAGDARGAVDRDIDKAKQYFTQGAKYAQQASDIQFSERFEIRLSSLE